jgi:hypothetical protein
LADNATIRLPNGVLVSRRADDETIDAFVDRCCAAGRGVVSPPRPDEISLHLEAVYQVCMAAWETRKYRHEPRSFATYVPSMYFGKRPEYSDFGLKPPQYKHISPERYLNAKSSPWNLIGCNWKTELRSIRFNDDPLCGFDLMPRVRIETMKHIEECGRRKVKCECGGDLVHDPVHSENICVVCGLVRGRREPFKKCYSANFRPAFTLIRMNKPTIRRDLFGNPLPPMTAKELKNRLNPQNLPGPNKTPIECLSNPIYLIREIDTYSAYWDDVRKDSGLLCDVHETPPYLAEDIFSQLFNFLFKLSKYKPLAPDPIWHNTDYPWNPRSIGKERPWTPGSICFFCGEPKKKRIDPNRKFKDQTEFVQSHYPKKIDYMPKEEEEFWKDIVQKHNNSRAAKHMPALSKTRYDHNRIKLKLKGSIEWKDESPGEPEYHHITDEHGIRMKRYIKPNKYTKSNINYRFSGKDKVMRQGDNTFGPDVWREVATVAAWRRVNNKTNKIKIPESTLGTFRGPIIETAIADCGYGLISYMDENFLERTKFTHSMCLDVNKWSIRPLRPTPEAVHIDKDILFYAEYVDKYRESKDERDALNGKKRGCMLNKTRLKCTSPFDLMKLYFMISPAPLRDGYQKIAGIYPPDCLGLGERADEKESEDEEVFDEEDRRLSPITSDIEGDDWYERATEFGNIVGGVSGTTELYIAPGDRVSHVRPGFSSGPFTHGKFLREPYRRCIRSYADEGPQKPFKRAIWPILSGRCAPGKEAKADICECKGCPYAVESSLYEREYDDRYLPPELSWSKACHVTYHHLPYINPYQVASYAKIAKFLKAAKQNELSIGVKKPRFFTDEEKVKEYLENPRIPWPGRPYAPSKKDDPRMLYAGTPIADAVKESPEPATRALLLLHSYALFGSDEPTGKNLKEFFIKSKESESNAKKYRDILTIYEKDRQIRNHLREQLKDLRNYPNSRRIAAKRRMARVQTRKLKLKLTKMQSKTKPKVLVKLNRYPGRSKHLYYINRGCYQKDWRGRQRSFRLSHWATFGKIKSILNKIRNK